MYVLIAFAIGFIAAFVATGFPGMLNLHSVRVSLRSGRKAAYLGAAGMTLVFTGQIVIALFFADWLAQHPTVVSGMKRWAVFIFTVFALFFIAKGVQARRANIAFEDQPERGGQFVRGLFMASMNFLTLPYFFAVGGWLLAAGYLKGDFLSDAAFVLGGAAGGASIFILYARSAYYVQRNAAYLTRNLNFIMGGIFVVLAVVQGVRVLS